MSPAKRKKPLAPRGAPVAAAKPGRSAPSARLTAQTRKVLGKHYRAKYGVR